ncbi:MAG: antitoxin AF2212-like protein [Pyrinomonadaceae bacterium]
MTQSVEAIYDGLVFRPDKPLKIKPNTRVQIVITTKEKSSGTVAEVASHLFGVIDVDAPADVSINKKHLDGFGE